MRAASSLMKGATACALSAQIAVVAVEARAGSLESAGDAFQILIPATAAALSLGKNDIEGFKQLVATGAVSYGVTAGLKEAFKDTSLGQRPNGTSGSFPSQHAAAAYAGAAYLNFRYGWEYGLPAFIAASFVGYTRVQSGQHRVRDVIASAAISYTTAFFLTDPKDSKVQVLPFVEVGKKPSFGIVASIRF